MRVVRIRKTNQALYVSGRPPEKKGDRFEATDVLPTRPDDPGPGCQIVVIPGAGMAFSCNRTRSSYGHAGGAVKTYVFDPAVHEVVGEEV